MSSSHRISRLVLLMSTLLALHGAEAQDRSGDAGNPADVRSLPAVKFLALNTKEIVTARLYDDRGDIDPYTAEALSHLLRDIRRQKEITINYRLLQLLYKVAYHFNASEIEVISGYRRPTHWSESRHVKGKACDFHIPGVDTRDLAAYARTLGQVGVGWYPRVDFVHLDVREETYYWVNRSRRGQHGWNRPLKRQGGIELDRHWEPGWDLPGFTPPFPEAIKEAMDAGTDQRLAAIQKQRVEERRKRRMKEKKASSKSDAGGPGDVAAK